MKVPDSSNSSTGNGNTKHSPNTKTKQISPAKRWCFTLNNYTDDEISSIVPVFNERCRLGLFSKEVGDSGTPHLQGYLEFKTKLRPNSLGLTNKIHWEKAKGNKNKTSPILLKTKIVFGP